MCGAIGAWYGLCVYLGRTPTLHQEVRPCTPRVQRGGPVHRVSNKILSGRTGGLNICRAILQCAGTIVVYLHTLQGVYGGVPPSRDAENYVIVEVFD